MEITEELMQQWEPKIQKMASSIIIPDLDREDLTQELRISLIKSAKGFDESRGIRFHTYLHTAMVNTLRTLLAKSNKRIPTKSLDITYADTDLVPLDIVRALSDETDFTLDLDIMDEIFSCNLSQIEKDFLVLRLEGLTMEEITEDLGEPSYKVRHMLRRKITENSNLYQQYQSLIENRGEHEKTQNERGIDEN